MKQYRAAALLLISIICIVVGWIADNTILGITGTLLLIPAGIVVFGALIWDFAQLRRKRG